MLWLGMYLPHLPLEVFQRGLPGTEAGHLPQEPAFAICTRFNVELANPTARALGVLAGQKRATALALAPNLIIRERNPAHEQHALQQLGSWALQYTPRLSLQMPDAAHAQAGLLLDIAASLRLFGGLDALLQRMRLELQALGYEALIGCAPTATAAWLFARWRDGLVARTEVQLTSTLAHLPVGLLASLEERRDTIAAIGVRTFRDLTQLPRSGLARRFGKALLLEMDLALGRQPELRPWFEAPLQFASTLELFADVEHAEALLFAARRQLCELAGWLAARHAAVRRFVLEARHDRTRRTSQQGNAQGSGPVTLIEARFASPTDEVDRMLSVLRERLATIRLPSAVHTLHLRCEEIVPVEVGNQQLFPVASSTEENLGRLVERLQARLGRDQVQRVLLAEDHRPEAAYRIETVADPARPLPSSAAAGGARTRDASGRVRTAPSSPRSSSSRPGHPHPAPSTTLPASRPSSLSSPFAPSSAAASTPPGRSNPHPFRFPESALAPSLHVPSSDVSPAPAAFSWSCVPLAGQLPRPLWLLHKPIALRERNQRPWWRGPLKLLSSPERIEGGWWDCNLVQRDYFIAEDDHAQWFWIYRTRGSGSDAGAGQDGNAGETDTGWYLQGIFG